MTRVQMRPTLDAPERWVVKKPTRLWAVLPRRSVSLRLRTFTTREAAERLIAKRGGTLLRLWFDGCVRVKHGRTRLGYLTQWTEA